MKTDRELLELAAKAAGKGPIISNDGRMVVFGPNSMRRKWAPLDDDGDALRLAVTLNMIVGMHLGHTVVTFHDPDGGIGEIDQYGDDHAANTRRAIVVAAADTGEAMQ